MILGLGTDIIEIKRIEKAIANERFLQRVFAWEEICYCRKRGRPEASFAARFAAKEAVAKAFGCGIGQIGWRDIVIINDPSGKPEAFLKNQAEAMRKELNAKVILSISHCKEFAIATAILEGNDYEAGNKPTDESDR